jgi:Phytanoyl-CoA dioxygenase (PhyH)
MNNYWAFLPMRASNDLLGDPAALRARFDEDSYLYFKQVLDPGRIKTLRRRILSALEARGWVKGAPLLMRGIACAVPVREGDEEYFAGYDEVQKLEEFHTLAHDPALLGIMQQIVGETAFPHPLKIGRLAFPAHYEISTPPHQDYPNNQGTPNLTAAWIPVGNCPVELGGLAILRGSHKHGLLPLDTHLGPGNRRAMLPDDLLEKLRWVTTDYTAGDVLVFGAMTVHASLHNASEFFMRISVDFRYQQEGEALTPICLEPHFERLSWDEVYAGWKSDRFQYYWKNLDFETVPFETLPLADHGDELTVAEMEAFVGFERRRNARFERQMARLASLLDPEDPSLEFDRTSPT